MTNSYDVIVLGLGAMGSAAAYHLAKRGHRVLGLDAYERGHARGSSHGPSRIIRQAYHEAPDYVPLVQRAYNLWRDLEIESGQSLLQVNGGLFIGRPDGRTVLGTLTSAKLHNLPYEELSPQDVTDRFPGFHLTDDLIAIFEPNAGFLHADCCLAAHLNLATRYGAELHHAESVRTWRSDQSGVVVETQQAAYCADRLIIAAGPWSSTVLSDLGLPLVVQRIVNVYFSPKRPELYDPQDCPILSLLVPEGHYYGVPGPSEIGFKLGRGDTNNPCTPDTIDRHVTPDEIAMFRHTLARYVPDAAGDVLASSTCMYTMTPDKHFVIDRHPTDDRVTIACGFSGHGFKFATVIGEILSNLATDRHTDHPISFLSPMRFRDTSRTTV